MSTYEQEKNSVEIQEVIGTMPSRVIRWGIFILGAVFMLLFFCSTLIYFPDMLEVPVEVSGKTWPVLNVVPVSNQQDLKMIRAGQKILVYLNRNNEPLAGSISKVDATAGRMVLQVSIPGMKNGQPAAFDKMPGNASITVRERSVFDKVFGFFADHTVD